MKVQVHLTVVVATYSLLMFNQGWSQLIYNPEPSEPTRGVQVDSGSFRSHTQNVVLFTPRRPIYSLLRRFLEMWVLITLLRPPASSPVTTTTASIPEYCTPTVATTTSTTTSFTVTTITTTTTTGATTIPRAIVSTPIATTERIGRWTSWSSYGECNTACGVTGVRTSSRICIDGFDACEGSATRTQACNANTFTSRGACYFVVLVPNLQRSGSESACVGSGTPAEFTDIGVQADYDALTEKMRALRPDGLAIWVENTYSNNGLEGFEGSPTWLDGFEPDDSLEEGVAFTGVAEITDNESQAVSLSGDVSVVVTPTSDGFRVDGTVDTADGALCFIVTGN